MNGLSDVTHNVDDIVPWLALNVLYGADTRFGWRIVRRTLEMEIPLAEFFSMGLERRAAQFPDEVATVCTDRRVKKAVRDARKMVGSLDDAGVTVLLSANPDYPHHFTDVASDAVPPVLYVSGDTDTLYVRSIGIVGSRAASQTGLDYAWSLARSAADRGFVVVSGGASGIDSAAHRGVVDADGRTVVVLPHGIEWGKARHAIDQHPGLVTLVSQFPPDLRPNRRTALGRNRTIAGLSGAVVAVESAASGGTMSTASHARRLSVPLFAVAWNDDAPNHQGTDKLLAEKEARPLPPAIDEPEGLDLLFAAARM